MKSITFSCREHKAKWRRGSLEVTAYDVNIPDILNAIDDEAAIAKWLAERREIEAEDERVAKEINNASN